MKSRSMKLIGLMMILSIFSCSKKELATVDTLDIDRYAGVWHEIAKLPNSFEKNLTCVSATYTVKDNGKISVLNKGYNILSKKMEEISGSAAVPNKNKPGELKVTFFWPFAGDYFVLDIDENYESVLIGSPSRKYLWILARDKKISTDRIEALLDKARELSFDVSKVEMTVQDCD